MPTTLILKNQFGEESINTVLGGSPVLPVAPQAAHTVVANNTGGSATPTAVTVTDLTTALPDAGVTAKVLTGLAPGANSTILSTDTILAALAKLQAQIDALA